MISTFVCSPCGRLLLAPLLMHWLLSVFRVAGLRCQGRYIGADAHAHLASLHGLPCHARSRLVARAFPPPSSSSPPLLCWLSPWCDRSGSHTLIICVAARPINLLCGRLLPAGCVCGFYITLVAWTAGGAHTSPGSFSIARLLSSLLLLLPGLLFQCHVIFRSAWRPAATLEHHPAFPTLRRSGAAPSAICRLLTRGFINPGVARRRKETKKKVSP